jgi:hypothetical protein
MAVNFKKLKKKALEAFIVSDEKKEVSFGNKLIQGCT